MDVAIVVSPVSPIRPAEANGPHAVALDLARGLRARGHAATIYAAAGSDVGDLPLVTIETDPRIGRASIRPFDPAPARDPAMRDAFERLFARVRSGDPDVVSQHAFDAEAFELGAGLPLLHTLHLPPISSAVVDAARRATAEPVATVSEAMAAAWLAAGVPTTVLSNGVADLGIEAVDARLVAPVALVAGRISPEKGTATAIRAARRAGLGVRVVGDPYDPAYHAAEVVPLLEPGEWLGPLPRATLSELMARSAALVMPIAWDEPYGLVAAEAQMVGCPVVGYRRGALPEIVPAGSGALVDPGDEAALVGALVGWRAFDRSAIRRSAQARLGVDRMVDAYVAALARAGRVGGGRFA